MRLKNFDFIFNPRSVAVAGVSTSEFTPGGGGQMFMDGLLGYGFKGKVYPLNPKGGVVFGLKLYANVKDIEEPVDYVISALPATLVPRLVEDCVAKGVKVLHIFTSGFSESNTEQGKKLEETICCLTKDSGLRIIGPNCMGVYCPDAGLSFAPNFPQESGPVALICQSGGNTIYFVTMAAQRGVRFSKVVSYGNACDVNESDLLEYLTTDSRTKLIAAYIEGVKDGQRFFRALKEAARGKPVIILKGGRTEIGGKVAASHTGSLAGSEKVWEGLLRQAGAIQVNTLEEMVDMVVTFLYLPLPQGRRVAMIGVSGGASVLAADEITDAGLLLPPLPQEIKEEIRSFLTVEAGTSLNNPLDLAGQMFSRACYRTFKTLADSDVVDLLIAHVSSGNMITPTWNPDAEQFLLDFIVERAARVHTKSSKPVAVVIETPKLVLELHKKCYEAGLPTYRSISNAAKAISRFLDYNQVRKH